MKRDQRGSGPVEAVVAIAIAAIIAAIAGMTAAQIVMGSEINHDSTTTVRQAQSLGYWVSRDILTSQAISTEDDMGTTDIEFLIGSWKDLETGNTYDIRYIWFDSDGGLKGFRRKQVTRDTDGVVIDDRTTLVADNIYTAVLSLEGDVWKLSIETRSGDKSLTREYKIGQRIEG
jgi:hypothetical protein